MTTPSPTLIDKVRHAGSPVTRGLDALQPLAALAIYGLGPWSLDKWVKR